MHENSCFVTLTYSPEMMPAGGTLRKDHLQRFFRRVRKRFGRVSYFAAGEYGEKNHRPHYHACIFGLDFVHQDPNSYLWKQRKLKDETYLLYRSPLLESAWSLDGQPLGFCSVGAVTYKSAAYVARYIMKKQIGAHKSGYVKTDPETGEVSVLAPEFSLASLKPAIGLRWLWKYWKDVYPGDFCVDAEGKHQPVPEYYDRWLEKEHPEVYAKVQMKREETSALLESERTPERLAARKKVFTQRMAKLKRGHEE